MRSFNLVLRFYLSVAVGCVAASAQTSVSYHGNREVRRPAIAWSHSNCHSRRSPGGDHHRRVRRVRISRSCARNLHGGSPDVRVPDCSQANSDRPGLHEPASGGMVARVAASPAERAERVRAAASPAATGRLPRRSGNDRKRIGPDCRVGASRHYRAGARKCQRSVPGQRIAEQRVANRPG